MLLTDLFNRILFLSSQYVITKNKVEVNIDSFRYIVEMALAEYSKASPVHKKFSIMVGQSPAMYSFHEDSHDEIKRVPDYIAGATPVMGRSSNNSLSIYRNSFRSFSPELIDPIQAAWTYRKPKLHVSFSGEWEITAVWKHKIESRKVGDTDEIEYFIQTITEEDIYFIYLIQGKFLQNIGRSRRAFTMSDLPITMDADQIVADGKEIEEKAQEDMRNKIQKHYLAFREG